MKKQIQWEGYEESGVVYARTSSKTLKVNYKGLLENSGAQEVYMHYGWGSEWAAQETIPLSKTDEGWIGEITVMPKQTEVNMCFKDNAENWDNNAGQNYQAIAKSESKSSATAKSSSSAKSTTKPSTKASTKSSPKK